MKSTKKTAVQKISPGTYRVVEIGGRSAITGRYLRAINAARHARTTASDATKTTTMITYGRSEETARGAADRLGNDCSATTPTR